MFTEKEYTPSMVKNFIYNTFYQVLIIVIPLISTPYVARVLGANGTGIYSFTFSNQTYFSMFAALGTVSYGTREISIKRDNRYQRSKAFWEIEALTVLTTSICIITWGVFIVLSKKYRLYYIILTINIIAVLFDISWLYAGLERFKYIVIQNSIFKFVGLVFIFIFVKARTDLWKYVLIMSLSTLCGNVSMWWYLPKFISKVELHELSIGIHFRETLVYFIPTIASSIYTVLDKTLLGILGSNIDESGFYEQATKIINLAKAIAFTSYNTVLGSRISYLFVNQQIQEIKERIQFSFDYIMFVGWALLFGLISISNRFVSIYFGIGYEKVSILIILMAPLVVIIGISNCLGTQYYTPVGLRSKSTKYILIGAIINLISNLILIPKFDSVGAIIATIVAEAVITLLYLKNCDNYLGISEVWMCSYKRIIAGVLMLMVVKCTCKIIAQDIHALLLQVVIGGLVYCMILLVLKDAFLREFFNRLCIRMKKWRKGK